MFLSGRVVIIISCILFEFTNNLRMDIVLLHVSSFVLKSTVLYLDNVHEYLNCINKRFGHRNI